MNRVISWIVVASVGAVVATALAFAVWGIVSLFRISDARWFAVATVVLTAATFLLVAVPGGKLVTPRRELGEPNRTRWTWAALIVGALAYCCALVTSFSIPS